MRCLYYVRQVETYVEAVARKEWLDGLPKLFGLRNIRLVVTVRDEVQFFEMGKGFFVSSQVA